VTARVLWRRLREQALLVSCDDTRQRHTVRRSLGGVRSREVIHLGKDALHAQGPSTPSTPSSHPTMDPCANGSVDRETGSDRPTHPSNAPRSRNGGLDGMDGVDGRARDRPPVGETSNADRERGSL
jgi:hypothetical protein